MEKSIVIIISSLIVSGVACHQHGDMQSHDTKPQDETHEARIVVPPDSSSASMFQMAVSTSEEYKLEEEQLSVTEKPFITSVPVELYLRVAVMEGEKMVMKETSYGPGIAKQVFELISNGVNEGPYDNAAIAALTFIFADASQKEYHLTFDWYVRISGEDDSIKVDEIKFKELILSKKVVADLLKKLENQLIDDDDDL